MVQIIQSLLPIILLVVTGVVLLRSGFMDQGFRKGLDKFVYWVALPGLIVSSLAGADSLSGAGAMTAVFAAATVIAMGVAYLVAWAFNLSASQVGVFAQGSFRGNLAFVAIPVILLATDGDEVVTGLAVLVFAPIVVLYNVLAVLVLTLAQHKFDRKAPLRLIKSMVMNPLLVSCVAGLLLAWLRAPPPEPVMRTMGLLGQTAGPLALVSLGGAVVTYKVHHHALAGLACAGIKLVVLPALTLLLAWLVGLDQEQRMIVLIFSATPTAVASYVLSVQLKGDPGLAAGTIVITTVLSALSLGAVLALA